MGDSRGAFAAAMLTVGLTVLLTLGISGAEPRVTNMDVTLTGVFVAALASTGIGVWLFVAIARDASRLRSHIAALAAFQQRAQRNLDALIKATAPAELSTIEESVEALDLEIDAWLGANHPIYKAHYSIGEMSVSWQRMLPEARTPANRSRAMVIRLGEIMEKVARG